MRKAFTQEKIPQTKMRILTPCVNTEVFRPRDKVKAREELNLEANSFLIFTIGHFKRGRQLTPLIQAIHELARQGKNVQLLVGWTGHGEIEQIKEIFSIAQNDKLVKIIPPTNQISLYYNASDTYVLSARPDYVIETPLSLVEALSSGTPAIAFDVNASNEIIKDGVNGYIIKDGNFAQMKSKLNYVMNNVQILEEFSKNARNLALNQYSFPKVGTRLFSLYEELTDLK
jgi:glycosyltransferase involved in cell wall biosynthesis